MIPVGEGLRSLPSLSQNLLHERTRKNCSSNLAQFHWPGMIGLFNINRPVRRPERRAWPIYVLAPGDLREERSEVDRSR